MFLIFGAIIIFNSLNLNHKFIKCGYYQKEVMSSSERKHYCQIIHKQIINSYSKLASLMDELTSQPLLQHCRIWKLDKGPKNLINVAIAGDKFLSKQSKSIQSSYNTETKKLKIECEEPNKKNGRSTHCKQLFKNQNHNTKNKNQLFILTKKQQEGEQQESSDKIYEQSHDIKRQGEILIEHIKKEDQQSKINDSSIDKQEDQVGLFLDFESVIKKQPKPSKRNYRRGPYKNYSKQLKQQMVQLYKQSKMPISKISIQYGVPIKNIKRWAQNGVERKEGAGRKRLDPGMQDSLYEEIRQKYPQGGQLLLEDVRMLALNLSKYSDFKASKGWIINFLERYQLNTLYHIS